MAYWTLTTSGAAVAKAGIHCNAISGSVVTMAKWSDEAEGRIEAETRRSWVTNYSGLPTGIKGVLSDVASSLIAMNIIGYDTTGYLSREADTLLNVNDDKANRGLAILKDFKSNTLQTP
jgi:hypothetical protein